MKENRFNIDFFEFSILTEACIPPSPIARATFFRDVIDKHYHELSNNERQHLFEWINRNGRFENGLSNGNEDCLLFNARFNPNNQYEVKTKHNGVVDYHEVFKYNNRYHTSSNTSIVEDYITEVKSI